MYHRAFIWPEDDAVARRLKADPDFSEEKRLAEMHRFRSEVTGLTLAYQHVLKVINCDQPNADVHLQGTDTVPCTFFAAFPPTQVYGALFI